MSERVTCQHGVTAGFVCNECSIDARGTVRVNPFPHAQQECERREVPYCPFYGLACRDEIWCPEKQAGFCGRDIDSEKGT